MRKDNDRNSGSNQSFCISKTSFSQPAWSHKRSPHSPSMILFTLHIRSVMIRLMASHGLLGPLATVEATIGAKDKMMIAPSNT